MNLNKTFLIGNITRDPEIRNLPSGAQVANFGIATNRMWKGKDGAQQKQTEFHNIVMFGRLAEIAGQYLKKGAMVMIEGRIQNRSWQGKDGQKKYRTEIVAEGMQMGPRSGERASESAATPPPEDDKELATVEYPEEDINPDEIPF